MITKNILEKAFFQKIEQMFLLREEIFCCCIGQIGNKKIETLVSKLQTFFCNKLLKKVKLKIY